MIDIRRGSSATRLIFASLWTFAFVMYSPSLSGDFVLDDQTYILLNPVLGSPKQWLRFAYDPMSVVAHPTMAFHAYRPLLGLSFGLNYLAGGANPFWFHLVSVVLHATNTCLVFQLAALWFGFGAAAAACALAFCLHPVQVESVAYIGSRPDLLATFFCLLAFLAYTKRHGSGPASWWASAAFACAALCKESALCFPAILAAYDLLFRRQTDSWRTRIERWAPFAAITAIVLIVRFAVLGRIAHQEPWGSSWATNTRVVVWSLYQDCQHVLWPDRLRMCYYYFPSQDRDILLAAAMLLFFGAWGAYSGFRRPQRAFAVLWFAIALLPVSNLIPTVSLSNDRFLYLPMVGAALLLGSWLRETRSAAALAAVGAALFVMGLSTIDLEETWQNAFELHLSAYEKAPGDPCTGLYLANAYRGWRMFDRAESFLQPMLNSGEYRWRGLKELALIRSGQRRCADAAAILTEAMDRAPGRADLRELMDNRAFCR